MKQVWRCGFSVFALLLAGYWGIGPSRPVVKETPRTPVPAKETGSPSRGLPGPRARIVHGDAALSAECRARLASAVDPKDSPLPGLAESDPFLSGGFIVEMSPDGRFIGQIEAAAGLACGGLAPNHPLARLRATLNQTCADAKRSPPARAAPAPAFAQVGRCFRALVHYRRWATDFALGNEADESRRIGLLRERIRLGFLSEDTDDLAATVEASREILERRPDDRLAAKYLLKAQWLQGAEKAQLAQAVEILERLSPGDPLLLEVRLGMAGTDPQTVRTLAQNSAARDPDSILATYYEALSEHLGGHPDRAKSLLQRRVHARPNDPLAGYALLALTQGLPDLKPRDNPFAAVASRPLSPAFSLTHHDD